MNGSCLCGNVTFEITDNLANAYQCHCSLCQKATGSSANAGTFVERAAFAWLTGEADIASFNKPTGFRNDFCSNCGSPVPNPLRDTELIWVPMGLLDDPTQVAIVAHLHLGSVPAWDDEADDCLWLDEGLESLGQLHRHLRETANPERQ